MPSRLVDHVGGEACPSSWAHHRPACLSGAGSQFIGAESPSAESAVVDFGVLLQEFNGLLGRRTWLRVREVSSDRNCRTCIPHRTIRAYMAKLGFHGTRTDGLLPWRATCCERGTRWHCGRAARAKSAPIWPDAEEKGTLLCETPRRSCGKCQRLTRFSCAWEIPVPCPSG